MRVFMLVALAAGIAAPAAGQSAADMPGWMLGCWEGRSGDMTLTERWIQAGDALLGVGEAIRDGADPTSEVMRIERGPDGLVFDALPGGQQRVRFLATSVTPREVVFDNPAHDFPQRVHYRQSASGDSLYAVISALTTAARPIAFSYQRVTCP